MKWIANLVMQHRARRLFRRLAPHLPVEGSIADIGSGTGHNAECIRQQTGLAVVEYDVADLHWVGPGPTIFANHSIPTEDSTFNASLLLYVLQYAPDISPILSESRRITRGPVIVIQSTYSGPFGLWILKARELFWGRLAFRLAAFLKIVANGDCPLDAPRYYTREELLEEFQHSRFSVRTIDRSTWPGLNVSRDLFVLERNPT